MADKSELVLYTYNDLLRINRNDFTLQDIVDYLHTNVGIQRIELLDDIVLGGDHKLLHRLSSVYSVVITGKSINDHVASALAKNSKIKVLHLDFINLPINTIQVISSSNSISKLYVTNCNVRDDGARVLAENTIFKELYVSDNQISDKGATAFLGNSTIKKLDLSHNPIRSFGIIDQLKKNKDILHAGIYNGFQI